jgi:MoaA/NifB/PqqE/SkfB family radical SAM enzyme
MNFKAALNTAGSRAWTLPIVLFYVTEGCNLHCITCSYRRPLPGELSLEDIRRLAVELGHLGLRRIVYSGGEPLMRADFPGICRLFQELGVKQTLLTNGFLLEKRLPEIRDFFSEIIVSIDGPTAAVHDAIRKTSSFDRIVRGFILAREELASRCPLSIRTVLQKANYRHIGDMVRLAQSLGAAHISFLAADVQSDAFGRRHLGAAASDDAVLLDDQDAVRFRRMVGEMKSEFAREFQSGFILEPHDKLMRIAQYYEAHLGRSAFPENVCNAPMISAVVTSTGQIQPCFFLPAYGTVETGDLKRTINVDAVRQVRRRVAAGTLDRCKTCVCSLHVSAVKATLDNF